MRTPQAMQLEVSARKSADFRNKASDGPHLRICGVSWQLPTRATVARPKFVKGIPTFGENVDEFPAADEMLESTPSSNANVCPTCGNETVQFDAMQHSDWLGKALACISQALSAKYELTDEQLDDLLVLNADSAQWLTQIDQWAKGEDTVMPEAPQFDLAELFRELSPDVPVPVATKPSILGRFGKWLSSRSR